MGGAYFYEEKRGVKRGEGKKGGKVRKGEKGGKGKRRVGEGRGREELTVVLPTTDSLRRLCTKTIHSRQQRGWREGGR